MKTAERVALVTAGSRETSVFTQNRSVLRFTSATATW